MANPTEGGMQASAEAASAEAASAEAASAEAASAEAASAEMQEPAKKDALSAEGDAPLIVIADKTATAITAAVEMPQSLSWEQQQTQKYLGLLQAGKIDESNILRKQNPYIVLNLKGANLCGANLGGANLGGANLGGAGLDVADLREANLGGANLDVADLREANLGGAGLRLAYLYRTNLCEANLGGADLYGAKLCEANLGGADLHGAYLYGANLCGANLDGANLCGAKKLNIDQLSEARSFNGISVQNEKEKTLIANAALQKAQTTIDSVVYSKPLK